MVNLAKWNELPPSYQALLTAACEVANTDMLASYDCQEPDGVEIAGGQWRAVLKPVAARKSCRRLSMRPTATYAEISATNATFKKIYDSQAAFRKRRLSLNAQIAEYTYRRTFMMLQQQRRQDLTPTSYD
jgi:TRAP-type mannitol/chloroaromatic compound transport system substrate-binding protein